MLKSEGKMKMEEEEEQPFLWDGMCVLINPGQEELG